MIQELYVFNPVNFQQMYSIPSEINLGKYLKYNATEICLKSNLNRFSNTKKVFLLKNFYSGTSRV